MGQIGYYNYYNNPHRYTPTEVQDRYQQMVDRYNGEDLYTNNENPYSDRNMARRKLDEALAGTASAIRARCSTQQEVHQYLSMKYFGTSDFAYTKKWEDPERYAMYENEYNAVCYGTIGGGNFNDPRLSGSNKKITTYEQEEAGRKAFNQAIISRQFATLLANHGISIGDKDAFFISLDAYTYKVTVQGDLQEGLLKKLQELLESKNNSKHLFLWGLNNGADNSSEEITKWRAYHNVKEYTGLDISTLNIVDGMFYTEDGQDVFELVKEGIRNDSSIGAEFKANAFSYVKSLMDTVAQKGWDNIPDIRMSLVYSVKSGFYVVKTE